MKAKASTITLESPVTYLDDMSVGVGHIIKYPVKVRNMSGVGAISLTMMYDPTVLEHIDVTNTAGLPNLIFGAYAPGILRISAFWGETDVLLTLPVGATLFTAKFKWIGAPGSTIVSWNDDDGSSCEYAGGAPDFTPFPDTPAADYYKWGTITGVKYPLFNPFVRNGKITPAPVVGDGKAVLSFELGNSGSSDLILQLGQQMGVVLTLSNCVPNEKSALDALWGTFRDHFNWVYDPLTFTYTGTQNRNILRESSGTIFVNILATKQQDVGFRVNIQPNPTWNGPVDEGYNDQEDDSEGVYTLWLKPVVEPNPQMNIVVRGFDAASWAKGMLKAGLTYTFTVGVAHYSIPDDQVRKAVRVLMTEMFKFYNVTTEVIPCVGMGNVLAPACGGPVAGTIALTKTWFGSTYTVTNVTRLVTNAKLSFIKITGKV